MSVCHCTKCGSDSHGNLECPHFCEDRECFTCRNRLDGCSEHAYRWFGPTAADASHPTLTGRPKWGMQ